MHGLNFSLALFSIPGFQCVGGLPADRGLYARPFDCGSTDPHAGGAD